MKLTPEQKESIRTAFGKLKSKETLLALLNEVKGQLYGPRAFPFTLRQLNYYIHPEQKQPVDENSEGEKTDNRYHTFSIKKKSGGERTIHAPGKGLKMLQTCLNIILQAVYEPHKAATGFVPGKSIVDNAKVHANSIYVYNIDLQDFFPSIDQARLWKRLQYPPFDFNQQNDAVKVANMIAAICCYEMAVERNVRDGKVVPFNEEGTLQIVNQNVLPQGAPTSPTITNIICEQLDRRLYGAAKRFGLRYSRYADDITFSSNHNVFQKDGDFIKELHRIIADQNFRIKESKTRLQKQDYRQEVTGIVVNVQPNVAKQYIKQLRKWLYLWQTYGRERAETIFLKEYTADKGNTKLGRKGKPVTPDMENVIGGKLDYLKMVTNESRQAYQKLKEWYDELSKDRNIFSLADNKTSGVKLQPDPIAIALEILTIKGEEGFVEAMEYYSKNINYGI